MFFYKSKMFRNTESIATQVNDKFDKQVKSSFFEIVDI